MILHKITNTFEQRNKTAKNLGAPKLLANNFLVSKTSPETHRAKIYFFARFISFLVLMWVKHFLEFWKIGPMARKIQACPAWHLSLGFLTFSEKRPISPALWVSLVLFQNFLVGAKSTFGTFYILRGINWGYKVEVRVRSASIAGSG